MLECMSKRGGIISLPTYKNECGYLNIIFDDGDGVQQQQLLLLLHERD